MGKSKGTKDKTDTVTRQYDDKLFKYILEEYHKGNIDEMYNHFSENVQLLSCYGDDKETRLRNYCRYKETTVRLIYKLR